MYWFLDNQKPRKESLSSSEAEYITLYEAVKEVMFVVKHEISMKLPVMVIVDNVGTIFMASNICTISCTK